MGALNTALDFSVYFSLTRLVSWFALHYLMANGLAYSLAVTNSFFCNRFWTFKNSPAKKNYFWQYGKFVTFNLLTLLIVQLTLYVLVSWLGIYDLLGKILVLGLSGGLNFFFSKKLVFA